RRPGLTQFPSGRGRLAACGAPAPNLAFGCRCEVVDTAGVCRSMCVAVRLQSEAVEMARRKSSGKATRRTASTLKMSTGRSASGGMTVREAGRLGGLTGGRKGGLAVKKERGVGFFQEIGRLG